MRNKKFSPAAFCLTASAVIFFPQSAISAYGNDDHRFSLQAVLRSLSSTDWQRRQEIERLLNEHKSEAPVVLTNALDSTDPEVQKNASEMLMRMSASWEFVIPDRSLATIVGILKSTHSSNLKSNLLRVVGNVGPRNDRLQPILLDCLRKDDDVSVRSAAADALSAFMREEKASAADEAVKVMCYCLKHDISPHVRRSIAQAMGNLPGPSEDVLNALIAAMDDNYKQVRASASNSLSRFGVRAKSALASIYKMYKEESDWSTRQMTLSAMVQIDKKNPKVLDALIEALDEPNLMSIALSYLSQLGVDAAPAVPRLIKNLEAEDNLNVRLQSVQALSAIGPKAQSALPILNKLSETAEGTLKSTVDNAIRRINAGRQTTSDG